MMSVNKTATANSDPLVVLGRAAAHLQLETLPAEILKRSKQRFLDTLGCLVASYDAGIANEIRSYVEHQGGRPEATLLPTGARTTVGLAGLAHATYMHGIELTDAAPRGTCHPGNEIVPIALAMGERLGCGGAKILPAIVAGYEVEIRVGRSVFPSAFYRGWWTPGLFGAIGPAITAAHMMGLDAVGLDNTLGIVLNISPTPMIRASEEGETVKWLFGGQAAMSGVLAAEMAARGVRGMRDVVGGWLPVVADKIHPERLTEGIAPDGSIDAWELTSGVLTKYYATVGPLTSPLDATFDLIDAHDVKASEIEEIEAVCMKRTALFNVRHPENPVAARGSLPFCVSAAVVTRDRAGLLGPLFNDAMLKHPEIWALSDRVRITEHEDYERQYPARSLARINIKLKNGKLLTQEVDRSANGRYLHPTDADIEGKFRMIAEPVLGSDRAGQIIDIVRRFETVGNVGELVGLLVQPRGRSAS